MLVKKVLPYPHEEDLFASFAKTLSDLLLLEIYCDRQHFNKCHKWLY